MLHQVLNQLPLGAYATHLLRPDRFPWEFTNAATFIVSMLNATCSHTFGSRRVLMASLPVVTRRSARVEHLSYNGAER
jgi:hypothetical protein